MEQQSPGNVRRWTVTEISPEVLETPRRFQNPLPYEGGEQRTNPDPFIFSHRGLYYCYSTDYEGVQVSTSSDLVNWTYRGYVFTDAERCSFWAPSVTYRNGIFYLYVSHRPWGSDDAHLQRMQVATSENPLGRFKVVAALGDHFLIDADVVSGPDGQEYLYYASNEFTDLDLERPGTTVVVDKLETPTALAGDPQVVLRPTLDEEIFAHDRFGDGRDWHTLEGSAYFQRRNWAYMTYSGNAFVRENYFIGYAMAQLRDSLGQLTWQKVPDDYTFNPLVRKSSEVEGTGHNSVILAPNLVDWWIFYHGRNAEDLLDQTKEQRVMRADRLRFDGDALRPVIPSATERDAPRPANLTESFQGPLSSRWEMVQGHGQQGDGGWQLLESQCSTLALAETVGPFVAEVHLKAAVPDMAARYGIAVVWNSPSDNLTAWFDAGRKTVEVIRITGNLLTTVASSPLRDFDFTAWQPLQIERGLDCLTIRRGNEVLVRAPHSAGTKPARFALRSQYTNTTAAAFRLTEHWDWFGAGPGADEALAAVVESDCALSITEEGVANPTSAVKTLTFREPLGPGDEVTIDVAFLAPQGTGTLSFQHQDGDQVINLGIDANSHTWTGLGVRVENQGTTKTRSSKETLRLPGQKLTTTVRCSVYTSFAVVEIGQQRYRLEFPSSSDPAINLSLGLQWSALTAISKTQM